MAELIGYCYETMNSLFGVFDDRRGGETFWMGQIGGTSYNYILNWIYLKAYKEGTIGDVTLNIYLADANYKPIGSSLGSSIIPSELIGTTSQILTFAFDTEIELKKKLYYSYVLSISGGDVNNLFKLEHDTLSIATWCYHISSENAGVDWTVSPVWDNWFEIWGTKTKPSLDRGTRIVFAEREGACEVIGKHIDNFFGRLF